MRYRIQFVSRAGELLLILCILSSSISALDTSVGSVAPLNDDHPSEKILSDKDLKKLESSYNEPPPEYYK